MKTRLFLMSCAVVVAMLVSCDRVALNEGPTAIAGARTPGGYPDIQATINASLDKALAVVAASAARSAERDPRYATLARSLRRERDGNWATARALSPDRSDGVTGEEQREIDALMADDPELDAAFSGLADELEDAYAAIPTIEITVQNYDEAGNPTGAPYTIRSENGVIDLGYRTFTVQEFLLWVQAQERRPERGFVIDRSWRHATYGSGRPWPADTVKLFFDTSISGSDTTWMLTNLRRAQSATGIRFPHYAASGSRRYQWTRCSSPYLKIMRAELGDWAGSATIGKVGCSFLKMDHGTARNESGEDAFYHEVGHVLGLIHEHQRYDRDEYVSVQRRGTNYDRRGFRVSCG